MFGSQLHIIVQPLLRSQFMAPLILHNVPDDERYVGDDGVVRPYAMVFPQYVCLTRLSTARLRKTEGYDMLTSLSAPVAKTAVRRTSDRDGP